MEITREQNAASYFVIPLIDSANRPDYKAGPTLATGDVKVIRHTGGSWNVSNIGTLPSAISGATTQLIVTLTATELNPDDTRYPVIVQFIDAAGDEWDDQTVIIWTRPVVSNTVEINGAATDGYNAILKLKSLDCQNNEGSGIIAKAGTEASNAYPGMDIEGVGSGAGIESTGGATNGAGAKFSGDGDGHGMNCIGSGAGYGVGAGGAVGMFLSGSNGNGLQVRAQGTDFAGIKATGDGSSNAPDIEARELGNVFTIDGVGDAGTLDVLKKIVDDNGGADYDATNDSLHEARDESSTNQTNIENKVDIVDANVDTSLVNQASMEGKIDGIQNNTRTVIGLPNRFNIPDTSFTAYKITLNFYDTDGNMEDPDDSEFSLYLEEADATDKTGLLFKEPACTTPLDASSKFSGYKELEKDDTGRYFCFVKIASTETEAQLMYDFACEENAVALHFSRSNLMGSAEIDEVTLEDSNTNKTIVAKALKDQNVSATSAVTGSIYDDLINQIDGIPDAILAKTVEGKTVEEIMAILLSMANGDYDVTIPVVGAERFTFWNQAKTVILWQVDVTATARTRL